MFCVIHKIWNFPVILLFCSLINVGICGNYEIIQTDVCLKPKSSLSNLFIKDAKQTIHLTSERPAAFLEQRLLTLQGFRSECSFKIKAKNLHNWGGIYLNILKVRLRNDSSTGKCMDYITVKFNGHERPATCGTLDKQEILSFVDESGEVKITLNLENNIPIKDTDYIELSFVVTPFFKCEEYDAHMVHCAPNQCISADFRNDGYHNCPTSSCADEDDCGTDSSGKKETRSDTKYLTAITSVLFVIFFVLGCFWCATSPQCCGDKADNSANTTNQAENQTMETSLNVPRPAPRIVSPTQPRSSPRPSPRPSPTQPRPTSARYSPIPVPCAPPLEELRDNNKDELPPPYESLYFPPPSSEK